MSFPVWRLLGAAMVTASGALLGFHALSVRRERERLLRSIAAGLTLMADELALLCRPLPELFARLGDRPFFRLLAAAGETEELPALWRRAALAQPLRPEDREALANLSAVLGRYDAQRQASELQLVRSRLTESADALEREIGQKSSRFPLLGAVLGAAAAVMLL